MKSETYGNRENPSFVFEMDRFQWKIDGKSFIFTVSHGFLGTLLCTNRIHPLKFWAGLALGPMRGLLAEFHGRAARAEEAAQEFRA